jgi:streptogramin lyase
MDQLCRMVGLVLLGCVSAAAVPPLELHTVPLPVQSPRLLGMSMDPDGFIWLGSTHRTVYRYDPRTGHVDEIKLPFDSSTSQTLCVGRKVYMLGQSYPKLIIYDRPDKTFREVDYPSAKPDVWYGTDPVDAQHFYLFDRGSEGVIKWDAETDTGKVIPYPYKTVLPSGGRYVAADAAVWCSLWDYTDGQYVPVGIARLDTKTDQFTGFFPFPKDDATDEPFADPAATLFYPHTLKGKLVPFDFKARRWCRPIPVPEYGQRFGFIGLGTIHDGRWYFSISTYNGNPATGCDGKPYHFCNGLLQWDPTTGQFAFPTLDATDAYYQVAYTLSAGGHFYATANNIREADSTLNNARTGDAIFWQTRTVQRE